MTRTKKILILLSAGLLVAGLFFFFTHSLIRLKLEDLIRLQLETRFDKKNGDLKFQSLRLKLFPSPHAVLRNIVFHFPDQAEGSIDRIKAYPKLTALISGRFELSEVEVQSPDLKLFTPVGTLPPSAGRGSALKATLEPALDKAFRFFGKAMPRLTLRLNLGRIVMVSGGKTALDFHDIHSMIQVSGTRILGSVNCGSSLWEKATIRFTLHDKTHEGSGVLDIQKLAVQNLPENLLPPGKGLISNMDSSLRIQFTTRGLSEIKGKTSGAMALVFHPENQEALAFKCRAFNGDFLFSENLITLKMDKLELAEPGASLSGEYRLDKKTPLALLTISGRDVDVPSARKAALALAGRFKITRTICDYVREGRILWFTFAGKAPAFKDYKKPGSIKLESRMEQGRAFIPEAELDLKDVFGDVGVSDGLLIGENLRARLDHSTGKNGHFKIGLHGPDAPMDLSVDVDADLAQLPEVLLRLIKTSGFQREMSQVKDCKGHGTGKLILGNKRNAIRPRVEVEGFSLSARYLRTPLAVSMTGKSFVYNDRRIEVHQAQGSWGASQFNDFSAVFDWRKTPALVWKFENASLVSREIYPWLLSQKGFSEAFQAGKSLILNGGVDLAKTRIEGPLFSPGRWSFTTSGKTPGLAINDESRFPSEVKVKGAFLAGNHSLSFSDAFFHFSDAALEGSGRITGSTAGLDSGDIQLKGSIGPESFPWFLEKIPLPFELRKGISVALSDFKTSWNPEDKKDFSGNLEFMGGPRISLAGRKHNDQLEISHLSVIDPLSDASMGFKRETGRLDVDFKGHLDLASLEKLIESKDLVSGSMDGDFHAGLVLDQMEKSSLEGFLEAKNLSFGAGFDFPFVFHQLNLKSGNRNYTVNAHGAFQEETNFHVDGKIYPFPSEMGFDLDIASDKLNLDHILSYFKKEKEAAGNQTGNQGEEKTEAKPKPDRLYRAPVKGSIRAHCKKVRFRKYQWSRVEAGLEVNPKSVRVDISEGNLCGIQTPGQLVIHPGHLDLNFKPVSEKQRMEAVLTCLGSKKDLIQGDFVLNGQIVSASDFPSVLQSIQGDFSLHAENGRIYKFNLLSKVFALLNITEIFRGDLPDLTREGFRFDRIDMEATVEGSKVILRKAFIDGSSMGIVMKGEIDLKNDAMDITLLVAPLKTMDYILEKIPVVNLLLKGALVSIPVQIKGSMKDPVVSTLSPASVDTGLVGFMKNTLRLPIILIEPFLSKEKEKEEPGNGPDDRKN
jgi:hypothetical protein